MIVWPVSLYLLPFLPVVGAALLGLFCVLGVRRIFSTIRSDPNLLAITILQLFFHLICIINTSIADLPLNIPVSFAAANFLALLIAISDRRHLYAKGKTACLYVAFFVAAVIWDFSSRHPGAGLQIYLSEFRYGLELMGRAVGPNVFGFSLVILTVICYNFTDFPNYTKRILALLCLSGLFLIFARLPLIIISVFLTFLAEDRQTRRYWIVTAIIASGIVLLIMPDLLASTRFYTLLEGRDTSNITRAGIYEDFRSKFDSLFLGSGQGAYFRESGFSLHNDFFEIMYSSGIIGFTMYYSSQFISYFTIWAGNPRFYRKLLSLFLVQIGFSLTESLSVSMTTYTGFALNFVLYSLVVSCRQSVQKVK